MSGPAAPDPALVLCGPCLRQLLDLADPLTCGNAEIV